MSGPSAWRRQRREVNAYNLFYSSLTARANPSLAEQGFRLAASFANVGREDPAMPDFVLYNGANVLLAEVKSGNNINDRHIRQMQSCASIDIETAEEFLKDAQVNARLSLSGKVEEIESCIVYQDIDEDYISENRSDSDSFRENLEAITEHAALLTQDYGGNLRILEGELSSVPELHSIFDSGIRLPENPPDEFMLTESMEEEILAVGITEIWGERVLDHEDPIVVSREQVRDYFAPRYNVPPGNVATAFEFLEEFGACSGLKKHEYEFSRDNIRALLKVEEAISEQRVSEYLREEGQTTFNEFED